MQSRWAIMPPVDLTSCFLGNYTKSGRVAYSALPEPLVAFYFGSTHLVAICQRTDSVVNSILAVCPCMEFSKPWGPFPKQNILLLKGLCTKEEKVDKVRKKKCEKAQTGLICFHVRKPGREGRAFFSHSFPIRPLKASSLLVSRQTFLAKSYLNYQVRRQSCI